LCVKNALKGESNFIHYCDFDRIIHWLRFFPEELQLLSLVLANTDFLITSRTTRAFLTHPQIQQEMEGITNQAFSLFSGFKTDVTAGSSAMNKKTAQLLINNSRAEHNETDTEWPMLAMSSSLVVRQVKFEGLEFETPDYFEEEIRRAGGLEAWKKKLDADPQQRESRLKLAMSSIKILPGNA